MTIAPSSVREPRAARHRSAGSRKGRLGSVWLTVLGLLFAVVVSLVVFGGYQIRPVLTGSMRPGLPVGGVVVTHEVPVSTVKVRDVIVFHRPDNPSELVVHRVISISRSGSTATIKTQGDANNTPDPWTVTLRGATAYRAVFSVPLLGYPAVWMHSATGQRELLLLAGVLIAIACVVLWRKEGRRGSGPDADAETASETDPDPQPDRAADADDVVRPLVISPPENVPSGLLFLDDLRRLDDPLCLDDLLSLDDIFPPEAPDYGHLALAPPIPLDRPGT